MANEEGRHLFSNDDDKTSYDTVPIISDISNSNDDQYKRRWASLILTYFGVLVLFLQFSLFWTSMWPYLTQIDETATESFFGFVIAAFSFGAVIASPILGYWSNRIKSFRLPVIVGLIINISGNVLFVFAESFDTNRKWVILVARFIAGVGAGAIGSLVAYVPAATTLKERNAAMSYLAATNSLGVLVGPGIQSALVPLGYPGIVFGEFRLNMYTMAAYFSAFCSLISIILFITLFKEYNIGIADDSDNEDAKALPPFDKIAAFACIWCTFVISFCIAYDDTIGSPFTMIMFNWTRTDAVLYNGIITAVAGVVDFCGSIIVGTIVLKYIQERRMMFVGLTCFIIFYVFSFSYPGLPPLKQETICPTTVEAIIPNISNTLISNSYCIINEEGTACVYDWCNSTTRVYLSTYVIGFYFLALGFSTGFTPCQTLFTKVLGPRRQGFMQGLNMGAESAANTISPIMVSAIFESVGPRVAWLVAITFIVGSMIAFGIVYKRLVPFDDYLKRTKTESEKIEETEPETQNVSLSHRKYSIDSTPMENMPDIT